jgi:putative inorganic carbon (HCO3(-)) transporter
VSATTLHPRAWSWNLLSDVPLWVSARIIHVLVVAPEVLFLITLGAMLFRPPELACCALDRIAFFVLVAAFLLRTAVLREPIRFAWTAAWPLGVLLVLSLVSVMTQPFETKTWSVLAAKYIVPYVLFHIARYSFRDMSSQRLLERFGLIALAYLCFIAIAFLVGAKELIYPRFILDPSLSIHIGRARGPFLQAVANGVTLNVLGLLALNAYRQGRLNPFLGCGFLIALPAAILATKTRAVWLSFLISVLVLAWFDPDQRIRRVCRRLLLLGTVVVVIAVSFVATGSSFQDRFEDRSPVEIRLAVYRAAWDMFLERPILGWGVSRMPAELETRVSDFHLNQFVVHNTYLEILVEHGLLGLALYGWLVARLFGLGRARSSRNEKSIFMGEGFRRLWPVLLGVYFVNGFFVVMNYQFVNGFLYTLAGMLSYSREKEMVAFA